MECILYDNGPIEPIKIYQDTSKLSPNLALFWTMWIFRTHIGRNKKYLVIAGMNLKVGSKVDWKSAPSAC